MLAMEMFKMIVCMRSLVSAVCLTAMVGVSASTASYLEPVEARCGHRDKTGTTGVQEKAKGSQGLVFSALTSRFSFQAEGTGFEPATPYGAPHFECGC